MWDTSILTRLRVHHQIQNQQDVLSGIVEFVAENHAIRAAHL
jgi:hypothetical protein